MKYILPAIIDCFINMKPAFYGGFCFFMTYLKSQKAYTPPLMEGVL